jgi:hypothetical protein
VGGRGGGRGRERERERETEREGESTPLTPDQRRERRKKDGRVYSNPIRGKRGRDAGLGGVGRKRNRHNRKSVESTTSPHIRICPLLTYPCEGFPDSKILPFPLWLPSFWLKS